MMMMDQTLRGSQTAEPWRWQAWQGEPPVLPAPPEPRKRPGPPRRPPIEPDYDTLIAAGRGRNWGGRKWALWVIKDVLGIKREDSVKRMLSRERSRWRQEGHDGILGP
jgi:hypothetical protein